MWNSVSFYKHVIPHVLSYHSSPNRKISSLCTTQTQLVKYTWTLATSKLTKGLWWVDILSQVDIVCSLHFYDNSLRSRQCELLCNTRSCWFFCKLNFIITYIRWWFMIGYVCMYSHAVSKEKCSFYVALCLILCHVKDKDVTHPSEA